MYKGWPEKMRRGGRRVPSAVLACRRVKEKELRSRCSSGRFLAAYMCDVRKGQGNPGIIWHCEVAGDNQQQFPDEAPDFCFKVEVILALAPLLSCSST